MRIAVSRALCAERDVSPLELFFDLAYVFAIGQPLLRALHQPARVAGRLGGTRGHAFRRLARMGLSALL